MTSPGMNWERIGRYLAGEGAAIAPINRSGIAGTVRVERGDDETTVTLELEGLAAGVEYPAHVHEGRCSAGGPVAAPLGRVRAGADGTGRLATRVSTATMPADTAGFVQVHGPDGAAVAWLTVESVPVGAVMLRDPLRVDITPVGRAAVGIQHRLYIVAPENKRPALVALLQQELGTTLVFARRKVDAEWLFHILERQGHPVTRIHSDRSQGRRVQALENFRAGSHRILVATDIAGRGIDVPGIEHVINFDIPESVDDYVHRAGRTARHDREGIVSTIATWQDLMMVRDIEKSLGAELPRCRVPGVEEWVEIKKEASRARRRL